MIRFLGNIEAKADAKGRVFIPATFRKQLQIASEEKLIMRKDVFQDCLTLYPESVWNEELNELRSRLNKWNSKHQLIFRQFDSRQQRAHTNPQTVFTDMQYPRGYTLYRYRQQDRDLGEGTGRTAVYVA